jgi:FkbM family methyltransferase
MSLIAVDTTGILQNAPLVRPAPLWLRVAQSLLRRMPMGRYCLMSVIARRHPHPFWGRMAPHGAEIDFLCDLRDGISCQAYLAGQYEPQETSLLREHLSKGQTFVDVGANWGYFSLLAAAIVGPTGKIVSLEPDCRLFRLLSGNVKRNGYSWISPLPVAAAAAAGESLLRGFDAGADNWGVSTLVPRQPTVHGTLQSVRTVALDDLLDALGIGSVDLVKIDIEGAEGLALRGMERGLRSGRYRKLLLELHPLQLSAWQTTPEQVLDQLRACGYGIQRIDHSPAVNRRAAYAQSLSARDLLAPLGPCDRLDVWPHVFCVHERAEIPVSV